MTAKFLTKFDIFGTSQNFRVKREDKHKTSFGGIISLFSIMIVAVLSIFFLVELLQRKDVIININQSNSVVPVNNISDIPMVFGLFNSSGQPFLPDNLYSLRSVYFHTVSDRLVAVNIPNEPCDINKHFGIYKEYFQHVQALNRFFCIPPSKHNLTIYGKYGDGINSFSYFNVYIERCKNTTTTKCFDQSIIDNTLKFSFFLFVSIFNEIDNYNVTQPNQVLTQAKTFSFSPGIFKRYHYFIKQVLYDTDFGFLFADHGELLDFHVQDGFYLDVLGSDNTTLGTFTLENAEKVDFYFRSFTKLPAVVANIGGALKAVFLISQIIVSFVSKTLYYLEISNYLFEFDFNKEKSMIYLGGMANSSTPYIHCQNPLNTINNNNNQITEKELTLSTREILFLRYCCRKKENIEILNNCIKIINKRISIEFFLKKIYEFESMFEMLLNEEQKKIICSNKKLKYSEKLMKESEQLEGNEIILNNILVRP